MPPHRPHVTRRRPRREREVKPSRASGAKPVGKRAEATKRRTGAGGRGRTARAARGGAVVGAEEFRTAMARFAGGVTVVTAMDANGVPAALTATAFSSVSKSPPLCLVCVDKAAEAHPVIAATGRFVVNVLGSHQAALSTRFATSGIDKFAGVEWAAGRATGCPVLAGAHAYMECLLVATLPGGDHDIYVGELRATGLGKGAPLLYYRGGYGTFAPEEDDG